ncbi:TonB-dependent receptor [Brevundimonas nasdae]|uniref:TonB-dependent receptor domain-containing protein n=1 Tax=Brevundimonas nasdae TaxID=172043 RepID=UPI001C5D66FD|nr:TonB-dependent receptor [Brevundimonas nasdae]QYC13423.1 TonB-dependent receptor [Brevundimonas nasdae]
MLDEVLVTGSRIRRDPTTSPTPLITISQEQLLSTGQTSVINYLANIPALSSSQIPSDTTGSGLNDGGLSFANLRALGSNRTLTLVNGRRHVGSSAGSLAVDVDTIPRLLIKNIEIVTGGASSVYGADAVSGVVNFITRDDFEGLEIDANYGQINSGGQTNQRISALAGKNFFNDRLNVYVHGEYENIEEVKPLDLRWMRRAPTLVAVDADPTNAANGPVYDGVTDTQLFTGLSRIDRPRWGVTVLANGQGGSPLSNPLIPNSPCTTYNSTNCYGVNPGKTFWYDGESARQANFGQRIGNVGVNRPLNIGGDGENPALFSTESAQPRSESSRFQTGAKFAITSNISAYAEAKYIKENTFDVSQPSFFDINLIDSYDANETNTIVSASQFDLRWSDNAFLPQNVKDAIRTNMVQNYSAPTRDAPGVPTTTTLRQWARHQMFGPQRSQDNTRELQRYVAGVRGTFDQVAFAKNVDFDIGYTYGKVDNVNIEAGLDILRFNLAADSVVDTAGVVSGRAGQIVCRVQLLQAQGVADIIDNAITGEDLRNTPYGQKSINDCKPLNVFGLGNQSQEALDYIAASVSVRELNEQHQGLATVSGQFWDFWGAGPIGASLGYEYRREYTEGLGRDRDTAGRLLFLNESPDFPGAHYTSNEVFGELSIPLIKDSFLGEYAELSGSYRYADYSTVGSLDVYGVNLVYRPVRDITFKASYNTSARVPDLDENFSPLGQTFINLVDPCATAVINGPFSATYTAENKANRIANCTALAAAKGLSYDFASATATPEDDYTPDYSGGGTAGVMGGNPFLKPEESNSFTFSVVYQPRFIPRLTIALDYFQIEIEQVISAVSAQTAANNCVNGSGLNNAACDTIFRKFDPATNPQTVQERSQAFKIGAPLGDPLGGFVWGRLDYSIGGTWLIDQQEYLDSTNAANYTEWAGNLRAGGSYPRVRFSSSLTYTPNTTWSINWTADWQSAQNIIRPRDFINNADSRPQDYIATTNFARHDFTVLWNVRPDLTVRAGVVNAFDAEQNPWLGTTLYSNFDPYGRRFFLGVNFRPW